MVKRRRFCKNREGLVKTEKIWFRGEGLDKQRRFGSEEKVWTGEKV